MEASEKYKSIYGEKSEKYIISMQNLGTLYRETKDYDKALNIFDDILTIINAGNKDTETENKNKIVSPNIEANILNAASGNYINYSYILIF